MNSPFASMLGLNQIGTSITPRSPFSAGMTQQGLNQGVAGLDRNNSLYSLFKQFDRPSAGVSRGPATLSRMAGPMAQYQGQRLGLQAMFPLQDAMTNARSMLAGQSARDNEALGLSNLSDQQGQFSNQLRMGQISQLMPFLQQLLGG